MEKRFCLRAGPFAYGHKKTWTNSVYLNLRSTTTFQPNNRVKPTSIRDVSILALLLVGLKSGSFKFKI